MKKQARAVIVGGGAVGCSIAYHLARAGWKDIVLLERDELTAGSTWHAAGLLPLFNMGYATSHIHDYSVKFYSEIAKETGLDSGLTICGNLRMAQSQERMDEFRLYATTADTVGIPYEWMTPAEIKERWPLVRTDDLRGAILHPTDGYINPADVTQSMARGARMRGAEIIRRAQVNGFRRKNGHWIVDVQRQEEKGGKLTGSGERFEIECETVITATGNHAQRTAAMIGCTIPAIPVEHQYIVTAPDPALAAYRADHPEHPVLRDADAKWYVREERGGWILGPYELTAPAWGVHGVPEHFRADLLPLDLERIETEYMSMIHRIPSTESLGLKDDYNGPICYTPDGNPLLGPARGVENFWFAEGFSFGITAAGGAGYYLAQMLTEGDAEIDLWSLDPRRFGGWMTRSYAARKNEEAYNHVYILHHPDEERPACRPLRTAPCYERMKARGAQFGQVNGWERPNYFAPAGFSDLESRSFRRGGWWKHAEREARAIREGVGMIDASAFAKTMVSGPGARAFLDWLTCNRLPAEHRVNLTYALTETGCVRTEYTICRLGEDRFYLVSAGAAQDYDFDNIRKHAEARCAQFGPITVQDVSTQYGVFAIAGPRARALMKAVTFAADVDALYANRTFPWLSGKRVELGMCPTLALRLAYTGELGWELHHPVEMQNYLFDRLLAKGEAHGLVLCGARAQNWLRQEKSYRAFGSDLGRDATPLEAGLDRFVDREKDYRGKSAMLEKGIRTKCVTLLIDGPEDADPWGREAVHDESGAKRVGRLTSGGYSVAFRKQIAIGYVSPDCAREGTRLQIAMLGGKYPAAVTCESPYDPKNERIRRDG